MSVVKNNNQSQIISAPQRQPDQLWSLSGLQGTSDQNEIEKILLDPTCKAFVSQSQDGIIKLVGDQSTHQFSSYSEAADELIAYCPSLTWRSLGDRSFCEDHGLDYAYMCGAMANGIASAELVAAAVNAGCLGSYGAAGQSIAAIEEALDYLDQHCSGRQYCINLIHSPNEPEHESKVVDLFIQRKVRLIEASAYLGLTPAVVRYRLHGIYRDEHGVVQAPNKIIAKASRIEVATRWWNPAPEKIIQLLLSTGEITPEQAELSKEIPMAYDLTAEADSGGHTDNRPALCMFPTFVALRDHISQERSYAQPLRLGLGGGIGAPAAAAAAFSMGAAYIVTGSINQACKESGSSEQVRTMLAEAEQADVTMAPAADMFEMGVKLQVLKRGTLFPMRAEKLFQLYKTCASLDEIKTSDRQQLETQYFKTSIENIWQETKRFFTEREPKQLEKAERDPKHKMALVFRWYLGKSSRWANSGVGDRQVDYQIWCGPAMGAFNELVRGACLEAADQRSIPLVAYNLLHGCCLHMRLQQLQQQNITVQPRLFALKPLTMDRLTTFK